MQIDLGGSVVVRGIVGFAIYMLIYVLLYVLVRHFFPTFSFWVDVGVVAILHVITIALTEYILEREKKKRMRHITPDAE